METRMTRLGSPAAPKAKRQTWVQTEREAHEAWGRLAASNPRAAALLHILVANMDQQAAVVASRGTLADLVGCSEATIKRAVQDLKAGRWIEVVQLGGKGGVNAFVVNSRVAWCDNREKLPTAIFTARVIAAKSEQVEVETVPLRRIPTLYAGERQLPSGPGEEPPSQPCFPGMDHDLPAIQSDDDIVLQLSQAQDGTWGGRVLVKDTGEFIELASQGGFDSPDAVKAAAADAGFVADRVQGEGR